MHHLQLQLALIASTLLSTAFAPSALADTSPEWPYPVRALRSPQAWEGHRVLAVRVEYANSSNGKPLTDVLQFTVTENYKQDSDAVTFTMPTSRIHWDPSSPWSTNPAPAGSTLLLWLPSDAVDATKTTAPSLAFVAIIQDPKPGSKRAPWAPSFPLIADVRRDATHATPLLESKQDLALQYYLTNRSTDKEPLPPKIDAKVQSIRDEKSLAPYTRLLASRLLHLRNTIYRDENSHLTWIKRFLAEASNLTPWEWQRFLDDLGRALPDKAFEHYDTQIWPWVRERLLQPAKPDERTKPLLSWVESISITPAVPPNAREHVADDLIQIALQHSHTELSAECLTTSKKILLALAANASRTKNEAHIADLRQRWTKRIETLKAAQESTKNTTLRQKIQDLQQSLTAAPWPAAATPSPETMPRIPPNDRLLP